MTPRLLHVANGSSTTSTIAEAGIVTDTSLAEMAENLSRTSPPLLACVPERVSDLESLRRTVAVTEAGRAVLRREKDWRWDEARQRITSNP